MNDMNAPSNQGRDKRIFFRRGMAVLLYTLLIFASLPVLPTLLRLLSQLFPDLLKIVPLAVVPAAVILFLFWAFFIRRQRDPLFYLWSAVFLFAYGPLVYFYCEYPAERFHLVEYGLLVLLSYHCLKTRMRSLWIFPVLLLYSFAVGTADEIIQHFLPNRVYEFKDVTINWASSFLAAGLVAGTTWERFSPGSGQIRFRRWAVALLVLMIAGQTAFLYRKYWRPPLNVILITVDSLRPDHLSCYGYRRDTSPYIDAFARKGVIFRNAFASAPWTSPGLVSIFTGLNPSLHGVQARGDHLLEKTQTIFKAFREHGYRAPDISYLTDIVNFSNLGLEARESIYLEEAAQPGDELLGWLSAHHRERFILWYHYRFLHLPYKPKDDYNVFLSEGMKAALDSPGIKTVRKETVIPRGSVPFTGEEREAVVALYDGQIRELDHFIQRLFLTMNRWKLHRNTLLVITGDHGEELFEHGFIGHASTALEATLYDEVLRIPLILYAPSRFRKGLELETLVRQVDIMPTILDLADLPLPPALQGVSLMPLIQGDEWNGPLYAISESNAAGYQSNAEQRETLLRAIRTEEYKLECREGPGPEQCRLFDLKRDPGETEDIFLSREATAIRLREGLHAEAADMQARRLVMLSREKPSFMPKDMPEGARLERPVILSPRDQARIRPERDRGRLVLSWTGDENLSYVIQYDVGRGWRNLKGSIPVRGTRKVFGPLPKEALEPLPYWNPYRIRISPFGLEEYWSDWVQFSIEPLK